MRISCYGLTMPRKDGNKNNELCNFLKEKRAKIINAEHLKKIIASGKKLRVKFGIDPTTSHIHLGHVVPFRILRAFQDAGHSIVVIVGDFTARIGDPSGQEASRRQLAQSEVKANERTYLAQISRIININKAEVLHNSEWYRRMALDEFLQILAHFPLKSAWEREDFQGRLKAGKQVRLHEAMYHVLQGYDSVRVRADVEIGGVDQTLNLLAGRELQEKLGYPPQDVVITPYLIGLDGAQKMSKSFGNAINIDDSPSEMVGKVMSIPDRLIPHYAEIAAWMKQTQVAAIKKSLAARKNPRDAKLDVAEAVAALYHGSRAAHRAREEFLKIFSKKELPVSIPRASILKREYHPIDLILALKAAPSRSEARRLIAAGAVEFDGARLGHAPVRVRRGSVIRVGKKKIFRIS